MTLVLTLASEHEVHMTCDFMLTNADTFECISDDEHKLVSARSSEFQAVVGVSGLARLDQQPIGLWIAERTTRLGRNASLGTLFDALRQAEDPLKRVRVNARKHSRLTFVIGAMQGSQAVIAFLSNWQNLRGSFIVDGAIPPSDLRLDVTRPSSPHLFIAGQVRAVRREERKTLERTLQSGLESSVVRRRMAGVNKRAAKRLDKFITEGCYAASLLATGRAAFQPFLVEQKGDFIPPDLNQLLQFSGVRLTPKILPDGSRAPVQLRQAASDIFNPSPTFFREQFKLRPNDSELWNNFGAYEADRGRLDAARVAYEKALQLNANNYMAARNLGFLLWRVYGDRNQGQHWIDVAMQVPDEIQRSETNSLLAQTLLYTENDLAGARACYEASITGNASVSARARWGHFLLNYEVTRLSEADEVFDDILAHESNYPLAVIGKAECLLRLYHDLTRVREIVRAALDSSPRDRLLISAALRYSLLAGSVDDATALLRRLIRQTGAASEPVLEYRALICLLTGGRLGDAEDLFRQAGGRDSELNLAWILWAQGRSDECAAMLESMESVAYGYVSRFEFELLKLMVSERPADELRSTSSQSYDIQSIRTDLVVLQWLLVHPDILEQHRTQLRIVLRNVSRPNS